MTASRKLLAIVPTVLVLALGAPLGTATAATPGSPGSQSPCYPFPAFCGPDGKPWSPWPFPFVFPMSLLALLGQGAGAPTP